MSNLFVGSLQRASFATLAFPVAKMSQRGERQVTEHEAWRRDGAELVDGGRKAYRGSFSAALFDTIEGYGDLFPRRLTELVGAFESQAEDVLAHPLLGTFRAVVTTWEPRLEPSAKNGCYLDFDWIEQRASAVGVVALELDRGEGDPRAEVASTAASADTALATAGVPPPKPLASVAAATLAKVAQPVPYTEVTRTVGELEAATVATRTALRAVAVTATNALALYRARAAVARVRVAAGRLRAALLPDPARTTVYTTPRTMTFVEVSIAVYGTPFRAADLRAANATARDEIPPGRVLKVLP